MNWLLITADDADTKFCLVSIIRVHLRQKTVIALHRGTFVLKIYVQWN
jgi:hypothetical protein